MSSGEVEAATPEAARRSMLAALPPLDLGPLGHLVVVGAHPCDVTLMAGGLIATAAAAGRPVDVVVASSGENSLPRSTTWTRETFIAEREVEAAVRVLAPDARLHLLRLPDGGLADHVAAIGSAVSAVARSRSTVVSTWEGDGDPDHAAVARAAARASGAADAIHLQAPILAWEHEAPAPAGWPPAARLDLAPAAVSAKAAALRLRTTPTEPLGGRLGTEVLIPTGPARPVDFSAMYAGADDPWGFADRWYERRKRALLNAALPRERLGRVLEIGCSTGLGSHDLAVRADGFVAVDVAASAVDQARRRLADLPHARVEQRRLPGEWPPGWGPFDVVVLSETGFYLAGESLGELADLIGSALAPTGVLVLCHWRPWVLGLDRGGDAVHAVVRERTALDILVRHEEEDFLLEILQAAPLTSVAQETGLR